MVFTLIIIALAVAGAWWAAQDAEGRGKVGWLIGVLTFITWPVGLVLWWAARPAVVPRGPERFPNDRDCPKCGTLIRAGSAECPNCRLRSVDAP